MPGPPATAKGAATSRRILDAAAEEFALRGIAGARVERIVQAARTNKAQLYGYFGNKDALFDAVIADAARRMMDVAPFDAADLPGWAVRIYDENLTHPEMVRLATWVRLERQPSGPLADETATHDAKVAAITTAQDAGLLRPGDPNDMIATVIAMACAWSPVSSAYAASPADPAADHDRRRAYLRESVRRAVAP
ncbi:TetR family transcriptional regulator [Actinoplanes rectilineatus]|uniref:TetR family transcriptional regulator n=1 Tax=Actinoplanes rectilineatus TaxID=113571 RepID=UPI0005F2A1D8|nr:TetR family transcriptional regulator [Actinoplanes rectilineatus]